MSQDTRAILHTIVRSSAVDLFHSFGVAIAPIERGRLLDEELDVQELAGSINFVGRGFTGTLLINLPLAVFGLIRQEPARPYTARDWVREASNQLLGRIKNRLIQFQIPLQTGLPSTPSRDAVRRLQARGALFSVYAFRTLRGDVRIALGGDIDHSLFVYAGGVSTPTEGDIILF